MRIPDVTPRTCEQCGARMGLLEGGRCAGCKRLLCRRHFPWLSWRGVLSAAKTELLCKECQSLTPRGRRGW